MTMVPSVNADFQRTCRLLFGQELGELEEFGPYLSEMMYPCQTPASSFSGRSVMLNSPLYMDGARYLSDEEAGQFKFQPLSINQLKDIDSLFDAAAERAVYCGNKCLGQNERVGEADNVVDSADIFHSYTVYRTKAAAYCSHGRLSESIYGVGWYSRLRSCMRCMHCFVRGATRCFETYWSADISDSYFTYNCSGCTSLLFCFNQHAKSYCIGNLQLDKERYLSLKTKLVGEMAEKLKKDKRLFSLVDLVRGSAQESEKEEREVAVASDPIPAEVERAYASASRILLGKERSLRSCEKWLLERAIAVRKVKGAFGTPTYKVEEPVLGNIPASRLATLDEALSTASRHIELADGESPSLSGLAKRAASIAFLTQEFLEGQTLNAVECSSRADAVNTYKVAWATKAQDSACSTTVTESRSIFGGYMRVLDSELCINGYNVTNCHGCFETDASFSCSDCYFCHNCENVEHGLFCFNVSGLRYAVCNVEVGREEYARLKKLLLDYVNDELDKNGRLEESIFNVWKKKTKI